MSSLVYLTFLMVHRTEGLKKRRRVIRFLGLRGGLQLIFGIYDMCIMRYLLISSFHGWGLTYDSDEDTEHVDFCQLITKDNCRY
jgi:hypothetical protein